MPATASASAPPAGRAAPADLSVVLLAPDAYARAKVNGQERKVARTAVLTTVGRGKQTFRLEGEDVPAIETVADFTP